MSKISTIKANASFLSINETQKNTPLLPADALLCEAGLFMYRNGKSHDRNRTYQKSCCLYKLTEICPINHPKFNNGKCLGCTKHITIQW